MADFKSNKFPGAVYRAEVIGTTQASFGCHSSCYARVYLNDMRSTSAFLMGVTLPTNRWGEYDSGALKPYKEEWDEMLKREEVINELWSEFAAKAAKASFVIFSSPANYGLWGKMPGHYGDRWSTPGFIEWLHKNPKRGIVCASPLVHNKYHFAKDDISLNRVWIWIPSGYLEYMLVGSEYTTKPHDMDAGTALSGQEFWNVFRRRIKMGISEQYAASLNDEEIAKLTKY